MALTRPVLVGRGPWAQKIYTTIPNATLCGAVTAEDHLKHLPERWNDSVVIASSTPSHYALASAALKHKVPIFCEKPMVSSLEEAERLLVEWHAAKRPLFVCDFVHLWSEGFERALRVMQAACELGPLPEFGAVFGGHVQRKDTHPVWDYGCHPIAMALLFGIDLSSMTLEPCTDCSYEWSFGNDHANFHVNAHPPDSIMDYKYARAWCGDLFGYEDGVWSFPRERPVRVFKNSDAPPLQRVLKQFIEAGNDRDHAMNTDVRAGMTLPYTVTQVLEKLCPSKSPFA